MSPSINITPDLLGMFKQQVSPVPTSVGADLEALCCALDLLQTSGQTDLNALAGCLSRLADWLKNDQQVTPNDVSGWTSEPFGVKGMGGMITCRGEQWEVIFNQDGSGQPYLGMWQSRLSGEIERGGSFKIQAGDGGAQLFLEGSRSLQVSLPVSGTVAWGLIDDFHQGLNSSRPPDSIAAVSSPPTPVPELPVQPLPSSRFPNVELSPDAAPTILARSARQPSENAERKPAPVIQPAMIQPNDWQCACGSKNTGQFCPTCGKEKPAPAIVQKNAAPQPTFCRQCGGALSKGARFCRNCGTETRS